MQATNSSGIYTADLEEMLFGSLVRVHHGLFHNLLLLKLQLSSADLTSLSLTT